MFKSYFPQFADFETAAIEYEWLQCRVIGNPAQTVRRAQARAELQRIAAALRTLIECDMPYWEPLGFDLRFGHVRTDVPILKWEREIFSFIMELSEIRDEGWTNAVIDGFVADAEAAMAILPDTANINWESVNAVDGLRWLWWRNTGKHGPSRALNPASTFCQYLRDGFAYMEIDADPISAFKRWAAKVGE